MVEQAEASLPIYFIAAEFNTTLFCVDRASLALTRIESSKFRWNRVHSFVQVRDTIFVLTKSSPPKWVQYTDLELHENTKIKVKAQVAHQPYRKQAALCNFADSHVLMTGGADF